MTTQFEQHLGEEQAALQSAREALLAVLGRLGDDDLDRATRGGWTVRRVLEHTLQAEWMYSAALHHLRGMTSDLAGARGVEITSVATAVAGFEQARASLLSALEGVDEESFYRLQHVGHEEYSVLSVLENVHLHDQEHGAQIERILQMTPA